MPTDKRITELDTLTPVDNDDLVVVVDISDPTMGVNGTTKKALKAELKGDQGIQGVAGDDAYVYIAYASDDIGTDFTLTFDAALNYIAIKTTTTAIVSPVASDFTGLWKNHKGSTGIQGIQGVAGLDINWLGTYNAGTTYEINDAVAYLGTSYIWINVTPASGHTPADDAYWDILALKGNDGAGSGDVLGPATNTADYIPQWNGTDSKTLKNGLAVPSGGLAGLTSPAFTTPNIGTPSAGTLTNCTGLPVNGIVDDTTSALGVGTIELGHVSDTTIARVGAGQISVENVNVVTVSSTDTLTNKTIGAGVLTLAETASILLDANESADEKWTGITIDGTAGATLVVGDLCYLDATNGRWKLTDANAIGTAGTVCLGLCILAGGDTEATRMLLKGTMRSATFPASITTGAPLYVSLTAGDITATMPDGVDDVVRVVGYAISSEPNTVYFCPETGWMTRTA